MRHEAPKMLQITEPPLIYSLHCLWRNDEDRSALPVPTDNIIKHVLKAFLELLLLMFTVVLT
jgi:hypothetical protein